MAEDSTTEKQNTTHFGFKTVKTAQKEKLVEHVFSSVANKYDIMNDIMSFGLHRLWKQTLMQELAPFANNELLDVASGTLDIAKQFILNGGRHAVAADINQHMLDQGFAKLKKENFQQKSQLELICCNAEELPFENDKFDYYTISFGIRNVTHINKALKEAYRVLKPGGKFICLEFSNVDSDIISQINDFYLFNIIPKIGKIVANDESSYQYLSESIKRFPKAHVFEKMIQNAGFENTKYIKMTFGVVAIHIGYKI